MSEYQYYEFQAIDRPLDETDREALRAKSTRAHITATSFTNSYEWGDLKGNPRQFMERWFDLHLYLANWGARRLMIRLPKRLVDPRRLDDFIGEVDCADVADAGDNLILDICFDEVESDDWDDGSGWLAVLAPLRADILAGDLRLFYLLWLTAVEADIFAEHEPEPLSGIGPLTGPLKAFAEFFGLDPDLVEAAAERSPSAISSAASPAAVRKVISAMTDRQKDDMLTRLFDGDPHVGVELRAEIRTRLAAESGAPPAVARTVGELRARASAIGRAHAQAAADKAAAERQGKAQEAEKARRQRLDAIARQGEGVWREIESEIARRNPAGYDRAASLLFDLRVLADERGTLADFARRVAQIRERHPNKGKFLERIETIGGA